MLSSIFADSTEKKRRSREPKVEANLILKKMKKKFLNFGLLLALGLTTTVFNSCDKDDDNNGSANSDNASKITATNVVNSLTQIKTVKAIAYWESGNDYGSDAIAQAPYQNSGFTLELPATLENKYLRTIADDFEEITISDRNFKSCFLESPNGYNRDDNKIGYFYLSGRNDDNWHYIFWMYADRDVTIKGEHKEINEEYGSEYIEKFNLILNKGWNIVYISYVIDTESSKYGRGDLLTLTISSKKPSGVNFTWIFNDDYDYCSAGVALKPAINLKLFSLKLRGNKGK